MVYAIDISQSFAPAKITTIATLLNIVLPLLTTGAGLIFLVMALLGGFNVLTHGDNPDALKKAYGTITYAILGLLIVIISFVAVRLIGKMLNIPNILPI
jgi:hypothetical protein